MAEKSENRELADAARTQPAGIDVPPEVAVHDRIMDAYYGKMGDDFMRKTQERVHWVCAQVQGGRILDVGCSQGIVPILLGREGKKVLGVDTDRDAIAVAKAHMEAGPSHVAANVDFVVADFMAHEFDEQRFDSVVMSEVLEHLVDPAAFVERAARLLNTDGRLVVTVPFGINDFVDHKRTYYLIEPYSLISRWFEIEKVQLFSRWIGFSGKRRPTAIPLEAVPAIPIEQFLAAEKTFYALERTLTENLRKTKEQLSSANQKYREVTQNQTQLRKQVADKASELEKISSALEAMRAQSTKAIPELERTSAALQEKLIGIARLEEQVAHLKGAVDSYRASEAASKADIKELQLHSRLAAEKAAELAIASVEAARAREESERAQKELTQSREELRALRRQLVAANSKAAREEQAYRKVASAVRQYGQWMSDERARVSFIQHTLAFQLGSILTFALRSPSDFVKTPLRLARLIGAAFRRGPDGRPRRVFIPDLPPISGDMPASSSDSAAKGIDTSAQAEGPVDTSLTKSVITKAGDVVIASAAVRYPDGALTRGKHAVALIRLFDDAGGRLELPVPGFGHSPRLEGHYRYLACSAGVAREIVRFKIPSGVGRVELEIRPFNLPRGSALDVAGFEIKAEASRKGPASPASEDDLGILGWPEYKINGKPVVLAVMDEFTTGCFENDVALILPRPDNWRALAEKYKPELFFIESAWKGNGGSWQYRVAEYANRPGEEVADMALYASENDIPMVFWNKEDPVHHQKFMVTAKMVDHVFTTDANMLDSYREKTGNQSVHSLPFAAQPALHFPAVLEGRHNQSCFAGSWYGDRHEARGESMRWLLRAANRHGLVIFDRNHGSGNFTFPDEYHSSIQGGLPYKELCAEYRRYRVFLNVNSVTESPTMFSRRVFELMACGTPVVSTSARGIEELFESKAVWLVDSEEQADEAIRTLLSDDAEWRRRSLAGIRDVFANHTYAHRLNQMFGQIGLATRLPVDPEVLLFGLAENEGEVERLTDIARTQRYPALRLRIGARVDRSRRVQLGSTVVEVVPASQLTNGECVAGAKAMGWISAAASYGPGYVRDLANAMTYRPDAHGWGKSMGSDAFACAHPGQLQGSVWRPEYFVAGPKPGQLAQPLSGEHFFIADGAEFAANGGRAEVLEK